MATISRAVPLAHDPEKWTPLSEKIMRQQNVSCASGFNLSATRFKGCRIRALADFALPRYQKAKAAIAQPVEHIIRNDGVGGSNPSCGTTHKVSGPETWVTERT